MANRFKLDKEDSKSILKGALIAIGGAVGTWLIVKANIYFAAYDDATKLMVAAVITIIVNTIRKFVSED